MELKALIRELKKRNVFRVAVAYAVMSWLIIQIITAIEAPLALPDWTDTFMITVLALCFPIALIIAWAFELTPEGLKKTHEVDEDESIVHHTGRKINKLIIASLSVVLVFMLIERVFFAQRAAEAEPEQPAQTASIAVLPFADFSPGKDQDFFSDGLTEELLNVLAKSGGLQVAGRTSSFQFKGRQTDLKEVGELLGVEYVLEGSVRKANDRLRITAQLIRAENGFHIWSETYDRTYNLQNLFSIQDEISDKVMQALKVHLLEEGEEEEIAATLPTTDVEAYEAFLLANSLLVNRQPDEIKMAIRHLDRAVSLDPNFADAWARTAIAYELLYIYGNIHLEDLFSAMRRNIDRALLLDSDNGLAYAALGMLYSRRFNDDEAEEALKKAMQLRPGDVEIKIWYQNRIYDHTRRDSVVLQAYKMDPLNPLATFHRVRVHLRHQEYDDALKLARLNLERYPDYVLGISQLSWIYQDVPYGLLDEAFIQAYTAYKKEPDKFNLMSLLHDTALNLDLHGITVEMEGKMKKLFPENRQVFFAKVYRDFQERNYMELHNSVDKYLEYADPEKKEQEELAILLDIDLYFDSLKAVNKLLIERRPEYMQDTLSFIPDDQIWLAEVSAVLLKLTGDTAAAGHLTDLVCEKRSEKMEFNGDIKKEKLNHLFGMSRCSALKGDSVKTAQILEEIYFNRNSKSEIFISIDWNHPYKLVSHTQPYREVRKRIALDVYEMRERAIQWLKDNGEWKEEWEQPGYLDSLMAKI